MARNKFQKSVAHSEAEAAWIDMYRRRGRPAKTRGIINRSVAELPDGRRYHATKGYRGRARRAA